MIDAMCAICRAVAFTQKECRVVTKAPVRVPAKRTVTKAARTSPKVKDPAPKVVAERAAKPAGRALQTLFAALAEATTEAMDGLEAALNGLEAASTVYVRLVRMGADIPSGGIAAARRRLGAVMETLGGHVAPGATSAAPRKAGPSSGGETRAPRGETGRKVLALLERLPNGATSTAILEKLGCVEKRDVQSVRNFLRAGQTAMPPTIIYDKPVKLYKKA